MGSRGSYIKAGGFTEYKYKTIMRYNNNRFVILKDATKSVKSPEMSNSKWAVYVTLAKSGDIRSVSFYNGSRRKYKQIDFLHEHDGISPHVHHIDPLSKDMRSGKTTALTSKEKTKVTSIFNFYKNHNLKELSKKTR